MKGRSTVLIASRYDKLQFLVPERRVHWAIHEIKQLMEDIGLGQLGLAVPMRVEFEVGPSWGQLVSSP